jgi:hypothetical protein
MIPKKCILNIYNYKEQQEKEFILEENNALTYEICDDFIFFEDHEYKLEIIFPNEVEDAKLYIGDIEIQILEIEKYDNKIKLTTELKRHFLNYFDLAQFSIYYKENEDESIIYSILIGVATQKKYLVNVEAMIDEIEQFDQGLLDNLFSMTNRKSTLREGKLQSIGNIVEKLNNISSDLKQKYPSFRNHPKTVLTNKNTLVNYEKVSSITTEGFYWIATNPDNLVESNTSYGLRIRNKNYLPQKVLSSQKINDFRTYENGIILGFIEVLKNYTHNFAEDLRGLLKNGQESNINLNTQLPDNYEIPLTIYKKIMNHYYRKAYQQVVRLQQEYADIYNLYHTLFNCPPLPIDHKPRFTHSFRNIPHYRAIFEDIIQWYDYGTYDLRVDNYLFKLIKLSEIYEYYCLIKLLKLFKGKGYYVKENKYVDARMYNSQNYSESRQKINNLIVLKNSLGTTEITIYYEPLISYKTLQLYDIDLYAISGGYYKPDFLFKIKHKDHSNVVYGIIDAKFSYFDMVKDVYLKDVCFKYLQGIGSTQSHFSPILFLYITYSLKKGIEMYNLQQMNRFPKVFPQVGVICLNPYTSEETLEHLIASITNIAETVFINQLHIP